MRREPTNPKPKLGAKFDFAVVAVQAAMLLAVLPLIVGVVPWAFRLSPNVYAIIPAIGLLTLLALIVLLFRRPTHAQPVMWFALFINFNALWCAAELLQRLSNNPAGDTFWRSVTFGITAYLPAFFYLFVRGYTNRSNSNDSIVVPSLVIGGSTVVAALVAGDRIFPPTTEALRQVWGFPAPSTVIALLFTAWAGTIAFLAILRLVVYFRAATSTSDRQQSAILIMGALVLTVVSATTNILLPQVHIYTIPPLGAIANTLLAVSVIYSIYKFDSFSVNLGEIAETVLAAMAEAVIVTDRRYRILYANQTADRLLGAEAGTLVHRELSRIVDGRLAEARHDWEAHLGRGEQTTSLELDLSTSGNPLFVNLHVSREQSAQQGYVLVLSDISQIKLASQDLTKQASQLKLSNQHLEVSQEKTLELLDEAHSLQAQLKREKAGVEQRVKEATEEIRAQRAQLEASVNSLPLGFVMTDSRGSIITTNQEIQGIIARGTGLKASDLGVDLNTVETILARIFHLRDNIKRCLQTGESFTKANIQFSDTFLSIFVSPIIDTAAHNPKPIGVVVLIEDVTDAVALQRSRDEFFSIASHELRTPLTAIRGNTEMMRDYFPAQFKDPSLAEMLGDIHESSVRLISIVNDFLDTSRLEQGKIEFKPTSFAPLELVKEVMKEYEAAGLNTNVFIRAIPPKHRIPNVFADHDRLKQALINLVSNALKFTEKGGVTIEVSSQLGCVVISVTDTGKGIPVESQHLLFRKFQQASNNILTRDSTRSTGLGLYISRLIMNSMGGAIELQSSDVGRGSTFVLNVPTAKPTASPAKPKRAAKAVAKAAKP